MKTKTSLTLFDPVLVMPAIKASFTKLSPRVQWRNPVMFVVYIGSILTTLMGLQALQGKGDASVGFIFAVALWLWFTVLFANFAEALAEGRSKAQAASLRSLKKSTWAKKFNAFLQAAQRSGLRLAAAFGQCFGEVGKQHGEPQPQGHGKDEADGCLTMPLQRLQAQQGRQNAADIDDKHHRVAPLHPWVQLGEGRLDGWLEQHRIEE